MKLSREAKTGIIVIVGTVLLIMGMSYLKSTPIFDRQMTLYAVYDHVGGLQSGTAVTINGLGVGKVKDVRFKDASGKLVVTLSVDDDFSFSKNSLAELYDTSPIGGKGLQIVPVFDGSVPIQSGDTLITQAKPGLTDVFLEQLSPVKLKMEGALSSADSLLGNVNSVLDDTTKQDLQASIGELKKLMIGLNQTVAVFNKNKGKLDATFGNLATLSGNMAKISDSLAQAGLAETVASLQGTAKSFDRMLAKMNAGEGTLGKMMTDKEMYDNLNESSRQLHLLLQDFRLNPKRYVNVSVFGKKQKEYSLPETDPAQKTN
ncbi:MlaD family protein [Sediminicola luteus]|uniref:ABC transporter substrate-binding protein n=1 Tax=Sediminicola luteus TaxID=319238 RepID=A0A2A4G3P8_9FLAO|nr:MlaD family protein [Sediminicola luteus]PCE62586.1 ABC transporter substrate-binding protein [Sediminicola luteus]